MVVIGGNIVPEYSGHLTIFVDDHENSLFWAPVHLYLKPTIPLPLSIPLKCLCPAFVSSFITVVVGLRTVIN
jgi:hypothetical protein